MFKLTAFCIALFSLAMTIIFWYEERNKTEPFCPYCNCYCDEPDFSKCEKCEFYNLTIGNEEEYRMKLIDADVLLNKCYHAYPSIDHYCTSRTVVDTKDVINAPTIDAEPVRHGHWIRDGVYSYYSVCGMPFLPFIQPHINGNPTFKYCPDCGAKMDEVSE